jgi:AraC-like DNA-binding protein
MIIDLAENHEALTTDFTQLTLVVPRQLLAPLLMEPDSQEGRVLNGNSALTTLAVSHLKSLFTVLGSLSDNDAPQVIEPTLLLIASALNGSSTKVENGATGVALSLLAQTRMEIERSLHRNLTVEALCINLNMSRSTLYRLFEPLGGVRAYIQERRLRRSTEVLLSERGGGMRICDIAYAWGFVSEAHYSRAFRQRYGMTPRDARTTNMLPDQQFAPVEELLVGDKEYERWLVENLRL